MEVEDAVRHDPNGYVLLDPHWTRERLRSEEIGAQRRQELEHMRQFADGPECRMKFLAAALDDPLAEACGRCDRCTGKNLPMPETADVAEAIRFLRGTRLTIETRKMWPPGFEAEGWKKIPASSQNEPGIALSVYGDAGYGRIVAADEYQRERFSEELVTASFEALKHLKLDFICWVPSASRSLVSDFAIRLAEKLGVPSRDVVSKVRQNQPQKMMQNSSHQLANVMGAFTVAGSLEGQCLLVDDVVDSGWTFTAIGSKLRQAGCSSVTPFALASARPREDA